MNTKYDELLQQKIKTLSDENNKPHLEQLQRQFYLDALSWSAWSVQKQIQNPWVAAQEASILTSKDVNYGYHLLLRCLKNFTFAVWDENIQAISFDRNRFQEEVSEFLSGIFKKYQTIPEDVGIDFWESAFSMITSEDQLKQIQEDSEHLAKLEYPVASIYLDLDNNSVSLNPNPGRTVRLVSYDFNLILDKDEKIGLHPQDFLLLKGGAVDPDETLIDFWNQSLSHLVEDELQEVDQMVRTLIEREGSSQSLYLLRVASVYSGFRPFEFLTEQELDTLKRLRKDSGDERFRFLLEELSSAYKNTVWSSDIRILKN